MVVGWPGEEGKLGLVLGKWDGPQLQACGVKEAETDAAEQGHLGKSD